MKKLIFLILSILLLTGCSTAMAKNNDVAETTKKVVEETTVKAVEESGKKTKTYGLADYKEYLEDEYSGNFRIEGSYVVCDIYDEYDSNGNFIPGKVSRVGKYDIAQLNEVLRIKDSGEELVKSFKSKYAANGKDHVIVSYVLMNGQNVELSEGDRPIVPESYVSKYVVEMYARGNSITSNAGGKTHLEQAQINNAKVDAEQAQRKAEADAKYESKMESQEAKHQEYVEKESQKRAEAEENISNSNTIEQIAKNASRQVNEIIKGYAISSDDLSNMVLGEREEGMTKRDKSIKQLGAGTARYTVSVNDLSEIASQCIPIIEEAISELKQYTSLAGNLGKKAEQYIKDLNSLKKTFN